MHAYIRSIVPIYHNKNIISNDNDMDDNNDDESIDTSTNKSIDSNDRDISNSHIDDCSTSLAQKYESQLSDEGKSTYISRNYRRVGRMDSSGPLTDEEIALKKSSLSRILNAIASRFESVGYCQGLDRIVIHIMRAGRCAVSLASMRADDFILRDMNDFSRERECFSVVEALFMKLNLCDIYSSNGVFGLKLRLWQLAILIEIYCPKIYEQMKEESVNLEIFCISWIQTLFLGIEAMPALTVDRLWDVFILESSWVIIFQVCLAIIRLSEANLLNTSVDQVILYFNTYPDASVLDYEVLINEASKIDIDDGTLFTLEEYYKNNCC
jgi:hypothetical protein